MPTIIHERIRLSRERKCPSLMCQMPSGFLLIGETQPVPGYCVLLSDPSAPHLNALASDGQVAFLQDMSRVGQVLLEVLPALRINYEILGNVVPALHGHIIPRFANEDEDKRLLSIFCGYRLNELPPTDLTVAAPLMAKIRDKLQERSWAKM